MSRLTTRKWRCKRLAVEALEQRSLLTADVVAECAAILPQAPLSGHADQDGYFDQINLVQVLHAGNDLTGHRASRNEGNWDLDGIIDELDLPAASQPGTYSDEGDGGMRSHLHLAPAHGRTELPLMLRGNAEIALDFSSAYPEEGLLVVPFSITATGIITQAGRIEVAGTGTVTFDVSSGTPIPVLTQASGSTTILATGDQISWVGEEIGTSQHATITYTDGTGRFEDVEGGFTYNYTPDPGNPHDLITYSFVAMGSFTF